MTKSYKNEDDLMRALGKTILKDTHAEQWQTTTLQIDLKDVNNKKDVLKRSSADDPDDAPPPLDISKDLEGSKLKHKRLPPTSRHH
ncbi:hypothetical protein RCL_jg7033.t1 [Rhizophagus clarus]|uniref:Uncharacterized protein n=1 Tax=Rhizophagus clarus TaxID=94130 RepID=A0A8H3LY88_9GLOM|nr:hypothetical protein RCL_jg7033.t1 [Rhizophagus clarus]